MLCPRCASNQNDDIKFCTSCGANLQAVREALATPEGKKFEWGNTWVAEMFQSGQMAELRKLEMERRMGITPEVKRYNEIKAGVIVSSVGIAIAIFLFVFMGGLIASGKVSAADAEILSRLWIAGVIPLFVGFALIANGVVVSKKLVEAAKRSSQPEPDALAGESGQPSLRPADTNEFLPAAFSVTEDTTQHLKRMDEK